MADIVWGSTSGYFRLGIGVSGSGTTRTLVVYGQSRGYGHNWSSTLKRSGAWSGSKTVSFYSATDATVTKELYRATVKSSGSYKASISYWNGSASVTRSVTVGSSSSSGGTTTPTKPDTPTGIKIVRSSGTACTISCNKMARATSYEWQFQNNSTSASWFSSTSTSSPSSARTPGSNARVRYRVRARNAGGVSSYSSATGWFYTTPATPTGVAISGDSLSALKLKYASNSDYVYGVQVRKGTTTILTVGTGLSGVAKSNISLPGTYEGSDTFSVRTFAGPDDSERGRAYSEWSAASRSVASQIVPKPTLVASATRGVNGSENPFGTQMLVTARGSASTIVGGNYMMLRARYKASTASSWGGWNTNFQNVAAGAVAKRTFTLTGTLDVTVVYDVQVDLSDSYGTTRWEGTVSTGEVALSLSKTGAAVGRIWDENSPATLQVAGHVEVEDPNVIVIGGVAYQRSGTINLGKVPITTAAGSMYRSDQVTVSMPYAPPPGWRWAFISVARAASSPIILHGYADLLTSQPIIILGAPSSVTTTSLYVTWMLVKNS